ncbi:MAG: putative voltage-gated ClC-type chloride channel ClcB [Planctomycetes bacterium ADurb.Bin401]|nr:MAG: putative voltage-gated ClC-type chloride channel ClcB [Planctomycetes bacterium ADurb.Bin401]
MEHISHTILFTLGLGIFCGLLGAWLFQKIRFPQVMGYIIMGLIIGESGFKLISTADIKMLEPFNLFALGIIGFLVGGELKIEIFRKYAKQFMAILFGEGLGAFFVVGSAVFVCLYLTFHNFTIALAGSVVFGAIASATDPASTIDVLWEYRSRGVLTTSLIAIVALDDALAMALYGLGSGIAQLVTNQGGSVSRQMTVVAIDLLGSLVLGGVCAALILALLKFLKIQTDRSLAFLIGIVFLMIAVAAYFEMDIILAAMALGFVLINADPRKTEKIFSILRSFSIPIYALFFVLVGARLGIAKMPGWLWLIILIYVAGRSIGKMAGSYIGAAATGSNVAVKRYLGLGLFAQGGVAIGLSIMASSRLTGIMLTDSISLSETIVFAITATTLLVQLIGPPCVKLGIKLAGEIGLNITEEDLIARYKVKDVMETNPVSIQEDTPLEQILSVFIKTDSLYFPVVNNQNIVTGLITIPAIRDTFAFQNVASWLLACDIAQPAQDKAKPDTPLSEAMEYMKKLDIEYMPVVSSDSKLIGAIRLRAVTRKISAEIIKNQELSDITATA